MHCEFVKYDLLCWYIRCQGKSLFFFQEDGKATKGTHAGYRTKAYGEGFR
jgi:hypothetical protein